MAQPIRLRPEEMVRLEQKQLDTLYASLGEMQAEEVICRAMEELAMRLALMERAYGAGEMEPLAKGARGLVKIADQIGMSLLAKIAGDVAICADRRDGQALGATLARLLRISDRSLMAVWDMADSPG